MQLLHHIQPMELNYSKCLINSLGNVSESRKVTCMLYTNLKYFELIQNILKRNCYNYSKISQAKQFKKHLEPRMRKRPDDSGGAKLTILEEQLYSERSSVILWNHVIFILKNHYVMMNHVQ